MHAGHTTHDAVRHQYHNLGSETLVKGVGYESLAKSASITLEGISLGAM
jgi:hypothetical protein